MWSAASGLRLRVKSPDTGRGEMRCHSDALNNCKCLHRVVVPARAANMWASLLAGLAS